MKSTVTLTEFICSPEAAFASAGQGTVTVTRPGLEDLVVTTAGTMERQRAAGQIIASLLAAAAPEPDRDFDQRLQDAFPWLASLDRDTRIAFGREAISTARRCIASERFDRLILVMEAWKDTAALAAHCPPANGAGHTSLEEPVGAERH